MTGEMSDWPTAHMVDLGKVSLAVYDYGPPSGECLGDVLLAHGMADVGRSLEPQALPLCDRYRVVAYDARGHGHSSHPGAYSGLHFVADLAALLDELSLDDPILIGHSLGGHTVANYAGLYPDRPRAIVLIEGLGPPAVMADQTSAARLQHGRDMLGVLQAAPRHRVMPDLDAAAARLLKTHTRLAPDRAMVLAAEGTNPCPDGGLTWRHDARTWEWIASVDRAVTEERWRATIAPTLAISGAEAWETWWARAGGPVHGRVRMTDEQFQAMLDCFTDLQHVDLAAAGHMIHFDQPDQLNELIDTFLRERIER